MKTSERLKHGAGGGSSWLLHWDKLRDRRPRVKIIGDPAPTNLSIFESPDGLLAVFSGYLFDQKVLIDQLDAGPDSSEAELISFAYERWGPDLLDRLRGGFVLAVWDSAKDRLVVGRDAMGLHPCFFWCGNDSFYMSSSLDAILSRPEVPQTVNRAVIAEYLLNSLSSHQRFETCYEAVRRLPSAHKLLLTQQGLDVIRYWDPVPPGFEWASDLELAQFEPLLERAVGRCLSVGADSIALSGGFDSVSIAVLAAEQLQGKSPLQALSMRFADPTCDEGPTQIAVARALQMPHLIKTLEESLDGRSHVNVTEALSKYSPCPVLSVWQSFYSGLFSSAPPGCEHLLLGTGGDDLLNVDLRYGADCLASFKLGALWHFLRVYQRTSPFSAARVARVILWDCAIKVETRALASRLIGRISPRTKNWVRRQVRKPSIVDGELFEILDRRRATAPSVDLAPDERSYVSALRYLTQAPLMLHELDQSYSWARQMGFTLLYPYFDQDFTAMLLRLHPEHLLTGGKAKSPLRRLVAKRLSSVTLPSKKVDFSRMVHGVLRKDGQSQWLRMGGAGLLTDLGIGRADMINSLMTDYFSGRSDNWAQVWRILSAEMWLRAHSEPTPAAP